MVFSRSQRLTSWPNYEKLIRIRELVYTNNPHVTICPAYGDCLRAFESVSVPGTKVVILGQDPYHSTDEEGNLKACGLSFAYSESYSGIPNSSMQNILQEIGAEEGFDLSLTDWTRQGVLLLNTSLTVELDKPLSHAGKYGWEQEISNVLKFLNAETDTVYVGWGSKARDLLVEVGIPEDKCVITSHPSRYSAHAGPRPFIGSKWHEQVNELLRARGREEIQWTVG